MFDLSLFQDTVYSALKKYKPDGVKLIWEKQGEPRPPKPYVSLSILAGPIPEGHDDERVAEDDVVEVVGPRIIAVSMNAWGENAMGIIGAFQSSFGFPSFREILRDENVVFVDSTDPQDVSALMENRWESRVTLTMRFRTTVASKDVDTSIVETVILENELDNSETEITSNP